MAADQVFIISWQGQHANACAIAQALESVDVDVFIVFSDPDPALALNTKATLLRRDNSGYAGDKIQACLDAFQGEHLLAICADCTCDDWGTAVKSGLAALRNHRDIWVWAPDIDYSGFGLERTRVMTMPAAGLVAVAHTDTIVFAWARPVVERLQRASLDSNPYGWGIGWMAVSFVYSQRKWAVVDPSIKVKHPKSRGYRTEDAAAQRDRFLMQLDPHERFISRLLGAHMALSGVTARNPQKP